MRVWKAYTIEDATVLEKAMKAIKTERIFLLEKTVSRCVLSYRIYNTADQGNHERDHEYGRKVGGEGYQDMDFRFHDILKS